LDYPVSLRYSRDHEWIATTEDDAVVRVGITDFAEEQLGDVVYVDLPAVGDSITSGESFGEVESTKSVCDLTAPRTATITKVNASLDDSPEAVKSSPSEDGCMYLVELSEPDQVESVMDSEQYRELIEREEA